MSRINLADMSVTNPYKSHSRKEYDPLKGHSGTDHKADIGTEVYLDFEVKVIKTMKQNQMGYTLYAEDKFGNILVFAHCQKFIRVAGEVVKPGDTVVVTGNTGSVTSGPHLHFEGLSKAPRVGEEGMKRLQLPYGGYNFDPVNYLKEMATPAAPSEVDLAIKSIKEAGLINSDHKSDEPVTFGTLAVILNRLIQSK